MRNLHELNAFSSPKVLSFRELHRREIVVVQVASPQQIFQILDLKFASRLLLASLRKEGYLDGCLRLLSCGYY